MASKIEQSIRELQEYINNCKSPMFGGQDKVVCEREELENLIDELRKRAPEEIKQYQKIISNREAIINDAKAKAQELISQATAQTTELISQHEIMLRAYEQADEVVNEAIFRAQEIIDNATIEANELKTSAMQYTDSLLGQVEDIVGHYIGLTNNKYDEMMNALGECYDLVRVNRQELIASAVDDTGVDVGDLITDDPSLFEAPETSASSGSADSDDTSDASLDLDLI